MYISWQIIPGCGGNFFMKKNRGRKFRENVPLSATDIATWRSNVQIGKR